MAFIVRTLADLKADLAIKTDHSNAWSDDEYRLALNETLRDWNLLTGRWRRRVAYLMTSTTWEYDLGATLTYGMSVKVRGLPLHPCSIWDLDLGRPTWRTETTLSGGSVPTTPTIWAPVSLQQIVIWPAHGGDAVIDALTVDGVSATPVLVEDPDFVDLGDEHLDVLMDYALHVLLFKQGGPLWQGTKPFFQAFLQAAAEENSRLKSNQKFRRAAGLNRRRDLQPTKDAPTQLDRLALGGR